MKLMILALTSLFCLNAMALESTRVPVSGFILSVDCKNQTYSRATVHFPLLDKNPDFVSMSPDDTKMREGSIAFTDKSGNSIEIGKFDVHAACINIPDENHRWTGVQTKMQIPDDIAAHTFISWDSDCYYGVWRWGSMRGWVSTEVDRVVVLKDSSHSIKVTLNRVDSLSLGATKFKSSCIKETTRAVKLWPN